jgi:hypothetical protein
MPQQQLKFVCELETYQIVLIGADGVTMLTYRTQCYDDDEAIDKLFAIKDISYARFEISCGDDMISQGSRCR